MLKKFYGAILGIKQSYNGSSQDRTISSIVYAILDIFKYKRNSRCLLLSQGFHSTVWVSQCLIRLLKIRLIRLLKISLALPLPILPQFPKSYLKEVMFCRDYKKVWCFFLNKFLGVLYFFMILPHLWST